MVSGKKEPFKIGQQWCTNCYCHFTFCKSIYLNDGKIKKSAFTWVNDMKKDFNAKTQQEKNVYITLRVIQISILLFYAYKLFMRITTGQHISTPLAGCLFIALIGISRIISVRNNFQGSEDEQRKFNKMVLRSAFLAIGIVFCVIVVTVLYAIMR